MKTSRLKIYGERNTGSIYLSELVELNIDTTLLSGVAPRWVMMLQGLMPGKEHIRDVYFNYSFGSNLGWKHSTVKDIEELKRFDICSDNIFFLTITKNPYSWLLSLFKRPYHNYRVKGSFETFLLSPWKTVKRENSEKVFKNPVEIWNQKNRSYLKLKSEFPTLTLKYEDLLANPEKIITKMQKEFSLSPKLGSFSNVKESTKGDKKDFAYYQDYYLKERWRENSDLTIDSIKIINGLLDDELLDYYDYNKILI